MATAFLYIKKKGFCQPERGEILVENFTYCSYTVSPEFSLLPHQYANVQGRLFPFFECVHHALQLILVFCLLLINFLND